MLSLQRQPLYQSLRLLLHLLLLHSGGEASSKPCSSVATPSRILCLLYGDKTSAEAASPATAAEQTTPTLSLVTPVPAPPPATIAPSASSNVQAQHANVSNYAAPNRPLSATVGQLHNLSNDALVPLQPSGQRRSRRQRRSVSRSAVQNDRGQQRAAVTGRALPASSTAASASAEFYRERHEQVAAGDTVTQSRDSLLDSAKPRNAKQGCICFACTSASADNSEPNLNCTKDVRSVSEAVTMNIDLVPCFHSCFTNVLRVGNYISTFRGCLRDESPAAIEDGGGKDDTAARRGGADASMQHLQTLRDRQYSCTRSKLMGAEFNSCSCDGHFCNFAVPNV